VQRSTVLQSRRKKDSIERERRNITRAIGEQAKAVFLSDLDEELPWSSPAEFLKDFDGLIFGGSSDFDFHGGRDAEDPARIMSHTILTRLQYLISFAFEKRVPILGICFGHQLIGHLYGAEVVHDKEQSKSGSFEVCLTDERKRDAIFKHLPEIFMAQYWHKDSLTKLPTGATLLAESSVCHFSALRYGAGAYTFQFHPEIVHWHDPCQHRPSPETSKIIPLWIRECVYKKGVRNLF